MNNKDKILLYLDGQMPESERIQFENELKTSVELQQEYEKLKSKFSSLNDLNNIEFDDSYFVNVVPNVRKRLEKKSKKELIPKFAWSAASVVIIAVVMIFTLNKKENINMNSIQQITANMNTNELEETLNALNTGITDNSELIQTNERSDSLIDAALVNEISSSITGENNYFAYDETDINSYINKMNEKEAEQIYNEILNKRYF